MSLIERTRAVSLREAGNSANSLINSVLPEGFVRDSAGLIARGIASGRGFNARQLSAVAMGSATNAASELLRIGGPQVKAIPEAGRPGFTGPLKQPVLQEPPRKMVPQSWPSARLFDGASMQEARDRFLKAGMIKRALKSVWMVNIEELQRDANAPAGPQNFNLLAIDASFGAVTVTGEAERVGASVIDLLSGTERVELRLVTMDDERGSLQRWFEGKATNMVARPDGTFGLPASYLVIIKVTQMATTEDQARGDVYARKWLMRPGSIETDLSRRAHELQELPMTFVQHDTFMEAR